MRPTLCLLSILTLVGIACAPPPPPGETREAALKGFESADAMRTYLADQAIARTDYSTPGWGWLDFGLGSTAAPPLPTDAADGREDAGANADEHSTTNIQELGVDESDLIKNDGEYIYLLKADSLRIVQATPPDAMQQVAKLDLPDNPQALYLYGDKLIALSQSYSYSYGYDYWDDPVPDVATTDDAGAEVAAQPAPAFDTNTMTATVINVTDRSAPSVEATLEFEGSLATSRMIGNKLHVVLTTMPSLPPTPTPDLIRAQPLEEWLPDYRITATDGTDASGDILDWQQCFYPANQDGYGITTVITVDIDNPTAPFTSSAITADAGTIYASTSALYVTDTDYDVWWGSRADTVVHKFDLTGDGADYVASGLVPGRLLNQYSLGEKDGYLRLATTVGWSGSSDDSSGNGVYVMAAGETAGALVIVGKVENIAPGEEIKSARFIGDRGFVVTFKNIDPFFTLDLSDPTNPRVLGELKVPGFSEYIHVLDENHMLTIGIDADDVGDFAWFQGIQLSIFDVTDFANPTLMHKEPIGTRGTYSEATSNPKAFNYYPQKNALAIPIVLYEGDTSGPEWGTHTFTGLYVYRVTLEAGFDLLGRISTREVTTSPDYWYDYDWYTRGVFIGDDVYAVTDNVVKAAPIETPSELTGTLDLPE
ncbi:MAG: beta-propeller domain-containing protein [Phycisphaerae bacterium]|nr:beta-propeller domain-containing protein [Phycisphaerae bacterium]